MKKGHSLLRNIKMLELTGVKIGDDASMDTCEDSFRMSGLIDQGNLSSDERKIRVSAQSSSQIQDIGKFLLRL